MANQKVQKSSSWTPQPQAKSSPYKRVSNKRNFINSLRLGRSHPLATHYYR